MGWHICEKHGGTGIMSNAAKDICELINNQEKVDSSDIVSIHVVYFDEGEYLFDEYYYFLKRLYEKLSLSKEYSIETDEQESEFNLLIQDHFGHICARCFRDYMNEIGYKLERPIWG